VKPLVILFAKAPRPGHVKTRLQPPLTAAEAAALHDAFVRDSLEMLLGLGGQADIELSSDEATPAWMEYPVARSVQAAGDLGTRMAHALISALEAGRPSSLVVGADVPNLPASHIAALLESSADVAFGPAEDGGFYSVACRRADERMFEGVRWSQSGALEEAMAACVRYGLRVATGPSWYDIDDAAGLGRLRLAPDLPTHTGAWLRANPWITESGIKASGPRRRPLACPHPD
jgi:uncharacterized protein